MTSRNDEQGSYTLRVRDLDIETNDPDALDVNYREGTDLQLHSERCPEVGQYGGRGDVVWVLLDVHETAHHVLVDGCVEDPAAAMTAAIEKLTVARDQLLRLRLV